MLKKIINRNLDQTQSKLIVKKASMSIVITDEHKNILNAMGHVLVTGGPGSGKTTIALQKAIKFIEEKKLLPGQNVLFLSFSRAAVSRINETAGLEFHDNNYHNQLSIQTFHSFFWEVIKSHGYLLGSPRRLKVLPPHDEESLRGGRSEKDIVWLEERQKLFIEKGRVCFDLFAPIALHILKESQAIRSICSYKFPLIIVDEAQDTDIQQWECVKTLAPYSQMIFLADLDQQIHDYREDVTPERITHITSELSPLQISLGNQNHRSAKTEINTFARDLLNNTPRGGTYNGISIISYPPKANQRDQHIRQSIGILYRQLRKILGKEPESIAFLATWGNGVKIISHALRETDSKPEIPHRVQFDETATYLSSRLIAYLLEPKNDNNIDTRTIKALEFICDLYKAKGKESEWKKYERWCSEIKKSLIPRKNSVIPEIQRIIHEIEMDSFSGNPEKDWTKVKKLLLSSTAVAIETMGKNAEFLMAFNRGKRISKGLSRTWEETGAYTNAQSILDAAIIETQIISENRNQNGINVMTIHKAKGKEFDGVILFYNIHSSPFLLTGDHGPFLRSRKLLFVGATRARYHTLILNDVTQHCPILNGFHL